MDEKPDVVQTVSDELLGFVKNDRKKREKKISVKKVAKVD